MRQCFLYFDFQGLSVIPTEEKQKYEFEMILEKNVEHLEATYDLCKMGTQDFDSDPSDSEDSD